MSASFGDITTSPPGPTETGLVFDTTAINEDKSSTPPPFLLTSTPVITESPAHTSSQVPASSIGPTIVGTTPHKLVPLGAIIGGVIGGVVFFVIAAVAVCLYLRRRHRKRGHIIPKMVQANETQTSISAIAHHVESPVDASALIEPVRSNKSSRRQRRLWHQMQQIQQELNELQSVADSATLASASASLPSSGNEPILHQVLEQMRAMRAQIEQLQRQQQSEWAQGLSDEPPPGYEAANDPVHEMPTVDHSDPSLMH